MTKIQATNWPRGFQPDILKKQLRQLSTNHRWTITQNNNWGRNQIERITIRKNTQKVLNSQYFTETINTIQIEERDIIASFDEKSLYPNIPTDKALYHIATNEDYQDCH